MKSFTLLLALFAIGCIKAPDGKVDDTAGRDLDTRLDTATPDSNTDTDPVETGDTNVDTDNGEIDTDTGLPDPECDFLVWNGGWNDDGTPTEVHVAAKPKYTLYSPTTVTISPGDDVELDIGFSSLNECGEVEFNFYSFYAWDLTSASTPWITEAAGDGAISSYENITIGEVFPESPTYENHPDDHNARYYWGDKTTIIGYDAMIATQVIPATGEMVYLYTFQVSEYVPSGTTLMLAFEWGQWTDPASGEAITDWNAGDTVWMEVVVE